MSHTHSSWSEDYAIGHPLIDSQHKALIELSDEIDFEIRAGVSNFSGVLLYLADYAKTHFEAEEQLLREANFPELPDHEENHQAFIYKIRSFQAQSFRGTLDPLELRDFVKSWVIQHILHSDMKYKAYLDAASSSTT